MALETNCLTGGCMYHTHISASRVGVVVDLQTELDLTDEQADEIGNLLHNQVELVIAFALERSRENKRKEIDNDPAPRGEVEPRYQQSDWKECPHCLWMSTEVHECPKCGTARDYKENDNGC